jgi:hypothetical protein
LICSAAGSLREAPEPTSPPTPTRSPNTTTMVLKMYGKCVIKRAHANYYDMIFPCLIQGGISSNCRCACPANIQVVRPHYFSTIVTTQLPKKKAPNADLPPQKKASTPSSQPRRSPPPEPSFQFHCIVQFRQAIPEDSKVPLGYSPAPPSARCCHQRR